MSAFASQLVIEVSGGRGPPVEGWRPFFRPCRVCANTSALVIYFKPFRTLARSFSATTGTHAQRQYLSPNMVQKKEPGRWDPVLQLQFPESSISTHSCGFAHSTAFSFGGLFVVAYPFQVADDAFLLAHFFETPDHLLDGFTNSRLHLYHMSLPKPF